MWYEQEFLSKIPPERVRALLPNRLAIRPLSAPYICVAAAFIEAKHEAEEAEEELPPVFEAIPWQCPACTYFNGLVLLPCVYYVLVYAGHRSLRYLNELHNYDYR